MRTATFKTEQEAHQFSVYQKNQGYIIDGIYQPDDGWRSGNL